MPASYRIVEVDGTKLVIGPPGATLVATADIAVQQVADNIIQRAVRLRGALADKLAWVPFIDALVVVARSGESARAATVVPLDLLADTLLQGTAILSPETIERIAALAPSLDVLTVPTSMSLRPDGRMAPCASHLPTASSWPSTTSSATSGQHGARLRGTTAMADLRSCSPMPMASMDWSSHHSSAR